MKLKILIVAILLSAAMPCGACSCINSLTVKQHFQSADIIIRGTVIKFDTLFSLHTIRDEKGNARGTLNREYLQIQFRISRILKGKVTADTMLIVTNAGCCSCGFEFIINAEYLVYGYKEEIETLSRNEQERAKSIVAFTTSTCTRTTSNADAEERILKRHHLLKKNLPKVEVVSNPGS